MKNQHRFFVGLMLPALLISTLFITSCQKGNQGAAGAPGATGAAGTQGLSGNVILSGDGTPSITLGNIGDYYLEIDSSDLFGPKTTAGWGSPASMTGAAGAAGAAGTSGAAGTVPLVDTFTVNTANWYAEGEFYTSNNSNTDVDVYPTQICVRNNSSITAGILDSGMVLVYFTADYSFYPNQWLPLPYAIAANIGTSSTAMEYNWSYLLQLNQIVLEFYLTPLSTTTAALPLVGTISIPNAKYKVVVVSGTLTHEIFSAIHKKVNKMGQISIN